MKKIIIAAALIVTTLVMCFGGVQAKAESGYLSEEDARYFLAFVYNSSTDKVTKEALSDDIYYKMLTGAYSGNSTYELAAKAAFLSFMDARIMQSLETANVAVKNSSDYLIEYFSKNLDEDSTGLVTDIYKENIAKSILELCGGDGVLELVETITDVKDDPDKYLDDVKAIASAFAYTYGQNVVSLYTYFDAAISNNYLKSTPGAYETAMSYNILALRDSNFMSFAAKLIPGITSWEDWIGKMDYWAEYVYKMRGQVSAGNSSDFKLVVYHPNCDDLEVKVLWYTQGQVFAPAMEREGYILTGWYFDEKCTIGPAKNDFVPTEPVTYLYAKWENRYYTIKFDSNCNEVADYSYELDRLNVNWYEPVMKRPGYIFNGWYWDSACTKAVTGEFAVSGDMTFYAGWISQYGYTISNKKATISYIRYWDKDENGNNITDMLIPETIGGYPVEDVDFSLDARAITGITFPKSMTKVKEWSFSWFSSLKNVVLNDGIQVIEEGAFARDFKLENVTFGKSLKTIGDDAFISCSLITEIDLPEGLISIGKSAFSGCGIKELKIPDSVTTIDERAFAYCEDLKTVTIGKGITNLTGGVFDGCGALESINVSADNPNYISVDGVLYNKDKTVLYKYPPAKTAKNFKVPETVTEIADSAFLGCTFLENIDISNVKTLRDSAFSGCENLKSIDVSAVNEFGERVFYGCKGLKSVKLPEKMEEIKYYTFYECTSLESITLPEGLKIIGADSFEYCLSLKEIIIPESVTDIGEYAFYGCSNLTDITLPSQLTFISSGMLGMCKSLEEIELPENVTRIAFYAFYGCENLKTIDIPSKVTAIDPGSFQSCKNLEKIIIPEGITSIDYMTFYGCTNLKTVVLPSTVTYIGSENFTADFNDTDIYFMGTPQQWSQVYIDEYGNEYLANTNVYCASKVIAQICDVTYASSKISGKIVYDVIAEDTTVLVGLFAGDNLAGVLKKAADENSKETNFEFDCETGVEYTVKAFFWDIESLCPKGKNVSFDVE